MKNNSKYFLNCMMNRNILKKTFKKKINLWYTFILICLLILGIILKFFSLNTRRNLIFNQEGAKIENQSIFTAAQKVMSDDRHT